MTPGAGEDGTSGIDGAGETTAASRASGASAASEANGASAANGIDGSSEFKATSGVSGASAANGIDGSSGASEVSGIDGGDSAFDRATAVALRAADEQGATYDVVVDRGWTIGDKPNGGYLLALLARAAVATASGVEGPDHAHPLGATAHYISAPSPGPAEIRAEVLRRGRQFSQVQARLVKDGFVRVEAAFTLGRLDPGAAPWWTDATPPEATPIERCPRSTPLGNGPFPLPLMDNLDLRLDPAVVDFAERTVTGRGEHWGWSQLADGRDPDPLSLLLAVDALPPATIGLGTVGWVPTLSLTAYVRALPAPGPLLVHQRARLVEDDLVDEVCDVWDSRGRLVAEATQLAAIRTPAP